jgi:hypothetical protein
MANIFTTAALTADGSTTGLALEGLITVSAIGTFGGGTITLQGSIDNSTWFSLTDSNGTAATFAANGATNIEIGELYVRGTLAGSTTPSVTLTFAPQRHTSKF